MGRRVDLAFDFIDFNSRSGFDGDEGWALGGWRGYDRPLVLAVPLLCKGETFADIAAGKHDDSYRKLAANIKANGVTVYAIRLGWEDNCQTTPGYALQDREANFANYKAARRHVYGLLKALLPDTLILQDVAFGWQQVEFTAIYDAASCDAIGLTVYPQTWSKFTTEPGFTNNLLTESWGLKGFGTWPSKPILITEYGAGGTRSDGHGAPLNGDDPTWTQATLDLFKSWGAHCLGICVWDFHAGDFDGLMSDGGFPHSAAVLKAAFPPPAPVTPASPAAKPFSVKAPPGCSADVVNNPDGTALVTLRMPVTNYKTNYVFAMSEQRHVETWGLMSQIGWWNTTGGGPYVVHVAAR